MIVDALSNSRRRSRLMGLLLLLLFASGCSSDDAPAGDGGAPADSQSVDILSAKDTTSADVEPQVDQKVDQNVAVTPVFSDGFESGDLKAASGGSWYNRTNAEVSKEMARTGSHSLRFRYRGHATKDSTAEIRARVTKAAAEIWLEWYLLVPQNYAHRSTPAPANNKFWIVGYDDKLHGGWQEPGGWTARMELNPGQGSVVSKSRFVYGNETSKASSENAAGTGPKVKQCEVIDGADRGSWVRFGVHFKVASSISASDGEMHFYKNGKLLLSNEGFPWGGVSETTPVDCFELLGWSNSGFASDTVFYVDDVKLYTTDPGW